MKQLSEYPKPKKGVQNNYAKEISKKTGTREDAVDRWLITNEIDPLTILQGIGSGRINRMDFVSALMSDEATLEFLQQYNSDGKWKSVWGAKPTTESLSEMVRRIIKEEIETTLAPGEVFVKFGSHRSREYAERALGQLPRALISFTSGYQLYKLTADQLQRLEGNKRVIKTVYKKLPPNHEWQNAWS